MLLELYRGLRQAPGIQGFAVCFFVSVFLGLDMAAKG